VITEETWSAIP